MNHGLKYAGWALVGGALGSAFAYLTAPASGPETRRRIARRVEDERHALFRRGEQAVEHAADYLKQGKRRVSRMMAS